MLLDGCFGWGMPPCKYNSTFDLFLIYFADIIFIQQNPYFILFSFFYSVTVSVIHKELLKHFVFFFSIYGEVLSGEWLQSTDSSEIPKVPK